jgi:pyruvate ferredoxin oxidoreductase beta subunit
VPYVAQACSAFWFDLARKAERAGAAEGPAFLNVLSDCPVGWGHEARLGPRILSAAVESRFWPLYEVVDGEYRLTYTPPERVPVTEWLAHQKRFAHLHGEQVEEIQRRIDADWDTLVARCAA